MAAVCFPFYLPVRALFGNKPLLFSATRYPVTVIICISSFAAILSFSWLPLELLFAKTSLAWRAAAPNNNETPSSRILVSNPHETTELINQDTTLMCECFQPRFCLTLQRRAALASAQDSAGREARGAC